jgi:hypothetical protein
VIRNCFTIASPPPLVQQEIERLLVDKFLATVMCRKRELTRAASWANKHPTTVFAMLMTVLALGPICLLLIGAWSFFWASPLKLILLVAFVLGRC